MGELKSLAGQTAIYGISSILGRLINYLLVPLHTTVFFPEALGVMTALYAYTAIFMILYTVGMETTYFRFVKQWPEKAYQTGFTVIAAVSTLISILIYSFSDGLAVATGYADASLYIEWLALILWIDAISALPFARLRHQNQAKRFAIIKVAGILLNIIIQYACFKVLPAMGVGIELDIKYIFLANLIANGITLVFLLPELRHIRIRLDMDIAKPMLIYGTPILLMGLAGMLNEQLDKILIEHLLPDNFYSNMDATAATGVYGQTFKLAIFMMLAIQAFRYAGEPFFFSKAEDKKAPELFARIMHYFILAGLLLFVLVSINVDWIAHIFLRKEEFRVALYLVPVLLFAKLLYGIYINLSVWFKLTDKTMYGLYFSVLGVVITIVGNIVLIPMYGMLGCAFSVLACYLAMGIACYVVGRKHYPIPYNFLRTTPYISISLVLVWISFHLPSMGELYDITLRVITSIAIVLVLWLTEKRKLQNPEV